MMKYIFFYLVFSNALAVENAGERAEQLARQSIRVQHNWQALQREAKKIGDPKLRRDFLSMLESPNFTVVEARRSAEPEIVSQLRTQHLLAPEFTGLLFPKQKAMPFIAAPGGPWDGHHSFPGGLVYHTLVNLQLGLSYAKVYHDVYGVDLDLDLIREATLWHDSAKALVLPWQEDGTLLQNEPTIAGTAAHHIWGLAEALFRGYSPRFLVALASAHTPPAPAMEREKLLGYLRAAAIIAGKSFVEAGLSADGQTLAHAAPLEAFIIHLDDHDFVITSASLAEVRHKMQGKTAWEQDKALSQNGDLPIFWKLLKK